MRNLIRRIMGKKPVYRIGYFKDLSDYPNDATIIVNPMQLRWMIVNTDKHYEVIYK